MTLITCRECRERLFPEDPSVPSGPYHHSTCDYFCNKPDYFREIEAVQKPQVVEHIHRHITEVVEKRKDTHLYE